VAARQKPLKARLALLRAGLPTPELATAPGCGHLKPERSTRPKNRRAVRGDPARWRSAAPHIGLQNRLTKPSAVAAGPGYPVSAPSYVLALAPMEVAR